MRRVLAISSFVAKGSVGLQATLPAFASAGIAAISIPTIVLSNHPGFRACAGTAIACDTLNAILDALDANGWLGAIQAIFTGYLPSAEHARFARSAVERIRSANPSALYLADPVLGDDPSGLYVGRETAVAVRDTLLPLASITTPNRFELAWLSGLEVTDRDTACEAARKLGAASVAATSIPAGSEYIENVLLTGGEPYVETVKRLADAPHGTGDYFAGVLLAQMLNGFDTATALSNATRQTERVLLASRHSRDLVFADARN